MGKIFILFTAVTFIVSVQGGLYSNFIGYLTKNERQDEILPQRYKRITPDANDIEKKSNTEIKQEHLKNRNDENTRNARRRGKIIFKDDGDNIDDGDKSVKVHKRSAEEEEMDKILHHQTHFDENRNLLTRSVEEFIDSVPYKPETKFFEQSATLKNPNELLETENQQSHLRSKFENINSREEKEMSSIKTLSSHTIPAGSHADQDGSGSSEEDDESTLTEVYNWPRGRYGLPKSIFGCPSSSGSRWKTGFRYHDTEDDGTENQRSNVFHLAANFSEDGISHEFCIKDDIEGEGDWPTGKYCVYKRGPRCPVGLKEGFVIWDDENTDNQDDKGGALPEGEYTEDTKIFFCCSTTGVVDSQISLPAKKPFFLFAFESIKCQKVLNMKATSEFIKFDDEDHGNTDYEEGVFPYGIHKFQKDHMLFLCYYEPTKNVVSYNSESELGTNLEEDGVSNNEVDQDSIRQGEEMMKEFMQVTGGVEDHNNKKERTKTIIKTIRVPVGVRGSAVATVIGLILGSFVIGTAIIILAKHIHRKPGLNYSGGNTSLNHSVDATWGDQNRGQFKKLDDYNNDEDEIDDKSDHDSTSCYTASEQYDSWSDLEVDDELVEDQLLPDSALKSGLELLFLKQQRHYWNQTRRNENETSNDE